MEIIKHPFSDKDKNYFCYNISSVENKIKLYEKAIEEKDKEIEGLNYMLENTKVDNCSCELKDTVIISLQKKLKDLEQINKIDSDIIEGVKKLTLELLKEFHNMYNLSGYIEKYKNITGESYYDYLKQLGVK